MKFAPVSAVSLMLWGLPAMLPVFAGGGNTCSTATVIPGVPYVDTGTTCGGGDEYDVACPSPTPAPDVVYRLSPQTNQCVNISMCGGTSYDAKFFIYSSALGGCPQTSGPGGGGNLLCASGGCPDDSDVPRETSIELTGGVDYWIVVDGDDDGCGNYQIAVNPCNNTCEYDSDCCDGIFCNGRETCVDGTCRPGEHSCQDDNPCTQDTCNEQLKTCLNTLIEDCCRFDDDCDDGNPCTNDVCDRPDPCFPGVCYHPPRPAGVPCGDQTTSACNGPDMCNGAGDCMPNYAENGLPCDDGRFCTVESTCQAGECSGGFARQCDDGDACTTDRCDEEARSCAFQASPDCCDANADCFDDNPCTDDVCVNGACSNPLMPSGTPCGSSADSACSAPDTCEQGICNPNHLPDGTFCESGNGCMMEESCHAGVCKGTPHPDCSESPLDGGLSPLVRRINFQAFLTDDFGDPIDGPTHLGFQFYDASSLPLGQPIVLPDVDVHDGLVTTQIPFSFRALENAYEVGVRINGSDELVPRVPLGASPYALAVDSVGSSEMSEHLDLGGDTSGELRIRGPQANGVAGGLPADYFVEVGTINEANNGAFQLCGKTILSDNNGDDTVQIHACDPDFSNGHGGGGGGQIALTNTNGDTAILLDGYDAGKYAASIIMYRDGTNDAAVKLVASETGDDGGQLVLRNSNDKNAAILDAESDNGAHLYLRSEDGSHRMAELVATETGSDGAQLVLRQADGKGGIQVDAESSSGAKIRLYQDDYDDEVAGKEDDIGILIDANYTGTGTTGHGRIRVRNEEGESTITLDADFLGTGKGRVQTDILRIDGGSDLAESFDVTGSHPKPGFLVSIDPANPGKLTVSTDANDPALAGVISGAGGIDPGLIMNQSGSIADGEYPVAMSGRVYCWVDADHGPVMPGDMLTTSPTPGHAMRVSRDGYVAGSVIGKAMTGLSHGRGLVLILVRPQ